MNSTDYIKKEARKSIAQSIAYHRYLLDEGIDLRQDPIIGKLLAELAAPRPDQPDTAEPLTPNGMIKDPNRFEQLQRAIRDCTARDKFPVGTIFADTWTDTRNGKVYNMPLRLVHYGEVRTHAAGLRVGAILQRVYATPFEMPFDGQDMQFNFGSNDLRLSEIAQWLNSNQPAAHWWQPMHTSDCPSNFTSEKDGYLRGCSADLRAYLAEGVLVEQSTDIGATSKICQFFLPSAENLHIDVEDPRVDLENETWEYYRDTPTDHRKPCQKRVFTDPSGSPQIIWLRSANRGNAGLVWYVNTDGSVYNGFANFAYACAPACVIA